jgi:DNA replication protein DnaC
MTNMAIPSFDNPDIRWMKCLGPCGDEYRPGALLGGLCPVCREQRESDDKQAAAVLALDLRRDEIVKGMLDIKGWEEFKFEAFVPKTARGREALEAAQTFDPILHDLFLCGPTGTGKSHLAGAILRTRAPRLDKSGVPDFEYARAIDILRRFRSQRNDEEELMRRYANLRLLVIDDLGAEKDTDHVNQIIYEIMDRRMMARRRGLVVTSNLGLSDMAAKTGSDLATSRMNWMCRKVYLDGDDMRMVKP